MGGTYIVQVRGFICTLTLSLTRWGKFAPPSSIMDRYSGTRSK